MEKYCKYCLEKTRTRQVGDEDYTTCLEHGVLGDHELLTVEEAEQMGENPNE